MYQQPRGVHGHELISPRLQVNLLALGLISALTAELTARGVGSRLHWRADGQTALLRWGHEAGVLVWALSWQSVFEYLWHWSMHTKWLYKHVHKVSSSVASVVLFLSPA